jgi:hypothetical protein
MTNIDIICTYIVLGCAWALWLEYFTTKYLDDPYNRPWSSSERAIQIAFWPITLLVFLHNFFKDLHR